MALRTVRIQGDPVLTKISKEIKEVTPRIRVLIDDMLETMYAENGVGLAAVQVGILKRLFVIDIGEEDQEPYVFINPVILEKSGSQTDYEGCLSLPGKSGIVTRPDYVKVRAYDENMEEFLLEAEGFLARAICHEYDHLEGKMYTEFVEGEVYDNDKLPVETEE